MQNIISKQWSKQWLRWAGVLAVVGLIPGAHAAKVRNTIPNFSPKLANRGLLQGGYIKSAMAIGTIATIEDDVSRPSRWDIDFHYGDHGDGIIQKEPIIDISDDVIRKNENKYLGIVHNYSTSSLHVYETAQEKNQNDLVILHYNRSAFGNPITGKTRYDVVDIYPVNKGQNLTELGIPETFQENEKVLRQDLHEEIKTGKIIEVFRWGRLYAGCAMVLQEPGIHIITKKIKVKNEHPTLESSVSSAIGGVVGAGLGLGTGAFVGSQISRELVGRGGPGAQVGLVIGAIGGGFAGARIASHINDWDSKDSKFLALKATKLKLVSEKACRYAEAILPFDRVVTVKYQESDHSPIIDYTNIVKSIEINAE